MYRIRGLGWLSGASIISLAACAREDSAAGGSLGADTTSPGADSSALLRLEEDWAVALVKRDSTTFRRLLAEGFVYSEDDRTMDRETLLREIITGADTVEAAHNEDLRVHLFGTTSVVTGWLIVQGRNQKGAFNRRYRFTDTWMKRNGTWQIIAAHDYVAP